MGKKDGAQRTKGNTKPSNSARSAELLQQTTGDFNTDIGSNLSPIFGLTTLSAEEEAQIPSEMKMAIRKMSKKDPTTRLKALQEFADICRGVSNPGTTLPPDEDEKICVDESTKLAVKAMLPFWPRLYHRLAQDVDRRVREACQRAHHVIIRIISRDVAPYLKSLAPLWHYSRSDPHPQAAALAEKSFSLAFATQEKRRNAIIFCQADILGHIQDNLLNQNAETLFDARLGDLEDMESKYFRVLSTSLSAYSHFIREISVLNGKFVEEKTKELFSKQETYHKAILGSKQFWKLSNHKSIAVRSAWYTLAGTLCEVFICLSDIFDSKIIGKLSQALLLRLDETEAALLPLIWEASLHLMKNCKSIPDSINLEKQVVTKLRTNVESGSNRNQINPVHIYPNVLPMVGLLLPRLKETWKESEVESKIELFFTEILSSIRKGFDFFLSLNPSFSKGRVPARKGGPSSSARIAIEAYFDCLTYALTGPEGSQRTVDLVLNNISQWLHDVSAIGNESLESTLLCSNLSKFVQRVAPRTEGQSNKVFSKFYVDLLNNICETIQSLHHENTPQSLESCAQLLLEFMRSPEDEELKIKKTGLTFEEPTLESDYFTSHFKISEAEIDKRTGPAHFPSELRTLLFRVVEVSFDKVVSSEQTDDARSHLDFVSRLLVKYLSFGDSSLLYKIENENFRGPVEMLNALMRFSVRNQNGFHKNIDASVTNLCIAISRSIDLKTKYEFYHGLFNQQKDRNMADRLLESLLRSEVDGAPEKKSILSSSGFSSRIQQIADDIGSSKTDIDKECLNLVAVSVQNNNLIQDQIVDNLFLQMSKHVKKFPEHESFWHFICDMFFWMKSQPSEKCVVVSQPGGINLLMRLLKISFDETSPVNSLATRIIEYGVVILKNTQSGLVRYLTEACYLIRSAFESNDCSPKMLKIAIELLKLTESSKVGIWQDYFLKMMPEVKDDEPIGNPGGVLFTGHPFFFLKMRTNLEMKVDRNTTVIDFYLRVGEAFAENNYVMTKESFKHHTWIMAALGVERFHDPPLLTSARKACNFHLENKLERQAADRVVSDIYTLSVKHGWEYASALENLLLNHEYYAGSIIKETLETLTTFQPLTEGKIQTLQVSIKYYPVDYFKPLFQRLISDITSFEMNSDHDFTCLAAKTSLLASCINRWKIMCSTDHNLECEEQVAMALTSLTQVGSDCPEALLFMTNLDEASFEAKPLAYAKASLMTSLLDLSELDTRLPLSSDAILCDLSCWCQTLEESFPIIQSIFTKNPAKNSVEVACFTVSILRLLREVIKGFTRSGFPRLEETDECRQKLSEWKDLFADNFYRTIINLYLGIVNTNWENKTSPIIQKAREEVISNLYLAMTCIPVSALKDFAFPPRVIADDLVLREATYFSDTVTYRLNHLVPLLGWKKGSVWEKCCVMDTAYFILSNTMSEVVRCLENGMEKDSSRDTVQIPKPQAKPETAKCDDDQIEDSDDLDEICELPMRITEVLERAEAVLKKIFVDSELPFGEPIPVMFPEGSYPCDCVLSLVLVWKLIIDMTSLSSIELRPKMTEFLRRKGHVNAIMETIFHLVTTKNGDDFHHSYRANLKMKIDALYHSLLLELPASVRFWWNSADKRSGNIVEKITIENFSPALWMEEASKITRNGNHENLTIKVRYGVREIVAIYSLEEDNLELVITAPKNFPLGALEVESKRKIGVTNGQWRKWMLQLTIFLQHQNGSIVDGLLVWKSNLDKRFDGIEECYICYFILHGASHQLPKVACRQCKKKFHSACLYKWFSTSGGSSCPLCRTLF